MALTPNIKKGDMYFIPDYNASAIGDINVVVPNPTYWNKYFCIPSLDELWKITEKGKLIKIDYKLEIENTYQDQIDQITIDLYDIIYFSIAFGS